MTRRVSRRRLLAGSVPVAVGLAGCSFRWGPKNDDADGRATTADPADDTGPSDGVATTERPNDDLFRYLSVTAGDPTYRRWQPGTGDRQGVQSIAYNVAYARDFRSDLPASEYETRTLWAAVYGYVGVEYEELNGVIGGIAGRGAAYVGSFERADVTERLTTTPYQRFETAEGVDYYRWGRSGGTRFVAVGDAGVVAGPARQDADDPARAFVDETVPLFATAAGDQLRRHEESATYERYTDEVGWPLSVWIDPPRIAAGEGADDVLPGGSAVPDDVAASVRVGYGRSVAGNELVDRYWLWTTADGPAGPETVRAAYDDPEVRAAALGDTDEGELAVRRADRVVDVAVQEPIADSGGGRDPPLVAADATVESGTLTLEHFAGDPLPLAQVSVPVGDESLSLGDGMLPPGESLPVDLPDGAAPQAVVYSPPAAATRIAIAIL